MQQIIRHPFNGVLLKIRVSQKLLTLPQQMNEWRLIFFNYLEKIYMIGYWLDVKVKDNQ